jgi:hypothetical protein
MANWWDNIQIKKGRGGCGAVTEEEKNNYIDRAVSTWEGMGLTEDQIALGIGIMGTESGFNPRAEGAYSKTEYGFSQFNQPTWEAAVKRYNTRPEHKARHEPDIDPVAGRNDPDSQIAVMGAWIPNAWGRAAGIPGKSKPKGFTFDELAYGKWHQGVNAGRHSMDHFLKTRRYNDPEMRGYFLRNKDRAKQALEMRRYYKDSESQHLSDR